MNLIIDIRPEVREELGRQAAAHGVDLGVYAANLLDEAAPVGAGSTKLSVEQLDQALRRSHSFQTKFPRFPMKLSRVKIYIEITTDAEERCLFARQQHSPAYYQKQRPTSCGNVIK